MNPNITDDDREAAERAYSRVYDCENTIDQGMRQSRPLLLREAGILRDRAQNDLAAAFAAHREKAVEPWRTMFKILPPARIELLAQWHDLYDKKVGRGGTEAQDDLREFATAARALLSELKEE